ncbi:MAG: MBL fold metallo-hydrolase [Armatimonadota bacterium]
MAAFTVEFLGTGTSTGIPMIGCPCDVCRSDDPRDQRMRPSILVRGPEGTLLVDTGPEMRIQMLRAGVDNLDAVLITHAQADHIFGMDDLRQFNFRGAGPIPVHSETDTLDRLRQVFDYCFTPVRQGGGKPKIELVTVSPGTAIQLAGLEVLPVRILHGKLPILGFVFDRRFAYCTDVSHIPPETEALLAGIDTVVLGAVRTEPPPHSSHFILPEALEAIARLAPRQAWLTHLSHFFHHARIDAGLPEGTGLAWDGLQLAFP